MNAYSPKETIELCGRAGTAKANMRIDKMFLSSVMAGMLLSFACAVLLSTNTAPWFQDNAPGLIRTVAALVSCLMFLSFWEGRRGGVFFPLFLDFLGGMGEEEEEEGKGNGEGERGRGRGKGRERRRRKRKRKRKRKRSYCFVIDLL